MKKFFKIVAYLIGAVIALLILAAIAIRVFFPAAKIKRLVEEQIRINLHREAQLGGAELGLSGLTLKQFRLSEVSKFADGTFLGVDKMTISWELAPLLSKRVYVKSITLEKPQVTLIRMRDGKTLNISDLAGATATAGKTPAAPAAKSDWSWRVDEIHLAHAQIRFLDRSPAQQNSTLSDIDLTIRDFDPTHVQGHLLVRQLQNPVYTAKDFSAEWKLRDIDANLGRLNGVFKMKQGPGLIQNLTSLANSSPSARLALLPLITLQKVGHLGFVDLGLPDLSHLTIDGIEGDYGFKAGTMTINSFKIFGPEISLSALGTVQLAPGTLAVDVNLKTPGNKSSGPLDGSFRIGGTLANPKADLEGLKKKAFKATIKGVMENPKVQKELNKTLKNLFH